MRFLTTTLVVSLLAFSLSTHSRENTIFGGVYYFDTEAQSSSETEDGSDVEITFTTGSRAGFRFYFQSFEDDGFFAGAGFQSAEGDYNACILQDCVRVNQTVRDTNLELGWSLGNWTPFVDFIWSDTEVDDSGESDADSDVDFGIGFWYKPSPETKLKININGLREDGSQILTSGFQRKLENRITIGGAFMYPFSQDISGTGFRFTVGWTL